MEERMAWGGSRAREWQGRQVGPRRLSLVGTPSQECGGTEGQTPEDTWRSHVCFGSC